MLGFWWFFSCDRLGDPSEAHSAFHPVEAGISFSPHTTLQGSTLAGIYWQSHLQFSLWSVTCSVGSESVVSTRPQHDRLHVSLMSLKGLDDWHSLSLCGISLKCQKKHLKTTREKWIIAPFISQSKPNVSKDNVGLFQPDVFPINVSAISLRVRITLCHLHWRDPGIHWIPRYNYQHLSIISAQRSIKNQSFTTLLTNTNETELDGVCYLHSKLVLVESVYLNWSLI